MKIILHIGHYKTGSTYIQKLLSDNCEQLEKKFDLCYPEKWKIGMFGHHGLIQAIKQKKSDQILEIEKSLKPNQTILLSSENFSGLNFDDLVFFKNCFPDDTIFEIYFFWRSPVSLIPSYWQEMIKHGNRYTLYEFAYNHLSRPFNSQLINFDSFLSDYTKCFGKENLKIIDYDNLRENKIDIFYFFLKQIAPASELNMFSENETVNISLEAEVVELLRLFNIYLKGTAIKYDVKYRNRIINYTGPDKEEILSSLKKMKSQFQLEANIFPVISVTEKVRNKFQSNFLNSQISKSIPAVNRNMINSNRLLLSEPFVKSLNILFNTIVEEKPKV